MRITFVKKILASGEACRKCADVQRRLQDSGYWSLIDNVLVADERDPDSTGIALATTLGVDKAPFFVVEDEHGRLTVYTVYVKFVREVLEQFEHLAPTYEVACA